MLHVATLALVFVLNGSGLASDGDSGKPPVVAGEPEQLTYEAAYRKAQEEKKPLVAKTLPYPKWLLEGTIPYPKWLVAKTLFLPLLP